MVLMSPVDLVVEDLQISDVYYYSCTVRDQKLIELKLDRACGSLWALGLEKAVPTNFVGSVSF